MTRVPIDFPQLSAAARLCYSKGGAGRRGMESESAGLTSVLGVQSQPGHFGPREHGTIFFSPGYFIL